jgi:citrate synthase
VAEAWVCECIEAGERIMGLGHRIYRVRDPPADVLASLGGVADEVLASARCIEAAVLRVLAEKKPDRRLDTNVEFYTALLLQGLGLDASLFTPPSRLLVWLAGRPTCSIRSRKTV